MVNFTQGTYVDEQQASDQRGGFRTVDKSGWGDLIAGLGKAGEVVADSMVTSDTNAAEAAIAEQASQLFFDSGLADPDVGGISSQDSQRFMRTHKAASMHGGHRGKLFARQLSVLTSDLRQKYPSADVDKLIKKVTGINPYEQALKYAEKDYDQAQKEQEEWAKKFEDVSNDPIKAAVVAQYGAPPPIEKRDMIEKYMANRQVAVAFEKENTELTAKTLRQATNYAIKDLFTGPSLLMKELSGPQAQALVKDKNFMATAHQEVVQMKAKAAKVKAAIRARSGNVPPADIKAQLDMIDQTVADFEDAITSKDINAASMIVELNSWEADTAASEYIRKNGLAPVIALDKMGQTQGAFVQAWLQNNEQWYSNMTSAMKNQKLFETNVAGNQLFNTDDKIMSAKELVTRMKDYSEKIDENTAFNNVVREIGSAMAGTTQVSEDKLVSMANQWLVGGRLNEAAESLDRGGYELVQYLTQPAILQNIAKKAPVEVRQGVLSGLLRYASENREITGDANDLSRYVDSGAGTLVENKDGTLTFMYNNDTMLQRAWQYNQDKPTGPTPAPASSVMGQKLNKLNAFFKNAKLAHEIMGQDWDEVKREFYIGANLRGIQFNDDTGSPQDIPSEFEKQDLNIPVSDLGPLSLVGDAISIGEGTSGEDAYDTILGHQQRAGKKFSGVSISNMTLGDLKEFTSSNSNYAEYSRGVVGRMATPLGKYQIVGSTLRKLQEKMGLPDDTVFSPEVQDAMFKELLKGRGYDKYMQGKLTKNQFVKNLQGEWEGLVKSEKSLQALVDALDEVRG